MFELLEIVPGWLLRLGGFKFFSIPLIGGMDVMDYSVLSKSDLEMTAVKGNVKAHDGCYLGAFIDQLFICNKIIPATAAIDPSDDVVNNQCDHFIVTCCNEMDFNKRLFTKKVK